jgi:hypothetical protein
MTTSYKTFLCIFIGLQCYYHEKALQGGNNIKKSVSGDGKYDVEEKAESSTNAAS